jgi:hypothetical protein
MTERAFETPRDEYLHSRKKIGLRALAKKWKAFGYSLDKIRRASRSENWSAERTRVQNEINTKTTQKTIESVSASAAGEINRIVEVSRKGIRIYASAIDSILERVVAEEKKTGKASNVLNLTLPQAVDGIERLARVNFIASRIAEGGTGGTYEELLKAALSKMKDVSIDIKVAANNGGKQPEVIKNADAKEKTPANGNGSNGSGNGHGAPRVDRSFLL